VGWLYGQAPWEVGKSAEDSIKFGRIFLTAKVARALGGTTFGIDPMDTN
jgi:hypothetical protein